MPALLQAQWIIRSALMYISEAIGRQSKYRVKSVHMYSIQCRESERNPLS